jgi:hypothetical protein
MTMYFMNSDVWKMTNKSLDEVKLRFLMIPVLIYTVVIKLSYLHLKTTIWKWEMGNTLNHKTEKGVGGKLFHL